MAKRSKDVITLGSGTPYIMEFPADGTIPDVATICVEDNRLGYVKGGAELTYTEETYEERDDLGYVSKIITTSEEAILKLGLLTWNGEVLQKLADRCKVTAEGNKRTIKIGGAENSQGNKDWLLCFEQKDAQDGNLWVVIRGRNTAGFTLTFSVDSGTVVEPEFKALPLSDGTLITLIEETSSTGA